MARVSPPLDRTNMQLRSLLSGVGSYLPERVVMNDEFARTLDTSDTWIRERTGIRQRHFAGAHETCAFMGEQAARQALRSAGAAPAEVDGIILATATPDQAFPATAVHVQAALEVSSGFAFDVSAACAGFIYALSVADAMIRARQATGVLVIGSEVYSRILNFEDRGTCVLFGDGAGAVFLTSGPFRGGADRGILSTHLHAQGSLANILYVDGAVGRPDRPGHLVMNGREVFRHAVNRLAESIEEALDANGLQPSDIDWLVPHQANLRIIGAVGRKLGLPPEKVVVSVDRHANTSAASIPLALAEAVEDGRIRRRQLVLMEALGGGLTWGSALVRM